MLLGVDVGGTFTDAVLAFDGRLLTAKAPTTPDDQSEGVIAAVHAVLDLADVAPDRVSALSHGMTVATNALLEGRGARTALGRARADDPGWPAAGARTRRADAARARGSRLRARGRGGDIAALLPSSRARAAGRRRTGGRAAGRAHIPVSRGRGDVQGVRARVDDRGRCGPLAAARGLPAAAARALRGGPAPRADDHAVKRGPDRPPGGSRPRRLDGALGPGRRRGGRSLRGTRERSPGRALLRHR